MRKYSLDRPLPQKQVFSKWAKTQSKPFEDSPKRKTRFPKSTDSSRSWFVEACFRFRVEKGAKKKEKKDHQRTRRPRKRKPKIFCRKWELSACAESSQESCQHESMFEDNRRENSVPTRGRTDGKIRIQNAFASRPFSDLQDGNRFCRERKFLVLVYKGGGMDPSTKSEKYLAKLQRQRSRYHTDALVRQKLQEQSRERYYRVQGFDTERINQLLLSYQRRQDAAIKFLKRL